MTVYSVFKKRRLRKSNFTNNFTERFFKFLERYDTLLTVISIILLGAIIFFTSVAFGNPVTNI